MGVVLLEKESNWHIWYISFLDDNSIIRTNIGSSLLTGRNTRWWTKYCYLSQIRPKKKQIASVFSWCLERKYNSAVQLVAFATLRLSALFLSNPLPFLASISHHSHMRYFWLQSESSGFIGPLRGHFLTPEGILYAALPSRGWFLSNQKCAPCTSLRCLQVVNQPFEMARRCLGIREEGSIRAI